jgi:hypothetical protein
MQGYFRKEANLDVVSDRVVESALSAMLEYHVSPKTLRSAVKDMRTSPGVREIDKAKLLDKLDVFEAQIGSSRFTQVLYFNLVLLYYKSRQLQTF